MLQGPLFRETRVEVALAPALADLYYSGALLLLSRKSQDRTQQVTHECLSSGHFKMRLRCTLQAVFSRRALLKFFSLLLLFLAAVCLRLRGMRQFVVI